jgi:hypothetical protein
MTRALVVDVDGVVSPVHGHTAWGDDVVAGHVFGPVRVSPTLCARLDQIAELPNQVCVWLTSWSEQMRKAMDPFPGRTWDTVPPVTCSSAWGWWKRVALEAWLDEHPDIDALCWLDDHLRPPARAALVRSRLTARGINTLLLAPRTAIGLTPQHLDRVEEWLQGNAANRERP